MTKDEVNYKAKMWEMINADYIKAKAEKEEREKQEAEEAAKEGNEHSSFVCFPWKGRHYVYLHL